MFFVVKQSLSSGNWKGNHFFYYSRRRIKRGNICRELQFFVVVEMKMNQHKGSKQKKGVVVFEGKKSNGGTVVKKMPRKCRHTDSVFYSHF